jgi:hypothetical protein
MTSLPERVILPLSDLSIDFQKAATEGGRTARYGVISSVLWPEYQVRESPTGKLVGSCTTEIAAWAVWRLMHVDWLVEAMTTAASFNSGRVGDPTKVQTS